MFQWGANSNSIEPIPDSHEPQPQEALQIGDHRFSISFEVVERPDNHCGDDLVIGEQWNIKNHPDYAPHEVRRSVDENLTSCTQQQSLRR